MKTLQDARPFMTDSDCDLGTNYIRFYAIDSGSRKDVQEQLSFKLGFHADLYLCT